jgi:hypothetical protein
MKHDEIIMNFDTYGAFFVVDQSNKIDQSFMAVPPRHPIMFYAIHHALLDIMETSTISDSIEKALLDFQDDANSTSFNDTITSEETTLHGTNNHTVTILGATSGKQIQFLNRPIAKNTRSDDLYSMKVQPPDHCKNKILIEINDAIKSIN